MANQRIDQLNAETAPAAADVLPVYSISGSDTKKITVKNLVQQGAALVDDASIPAAKVNFSGISGTSLSSGTVTATKFDTSTIPATGGITVSSSNLQLVAPTSPIVRNAGTGSLEHAVSGVTAGTYTKVTVDTKGHVTVGAAIAAGDLPIAISGTVGAMSPGTGLSVTGGGVVNHTNSVTAGTTSGITFDAQGHITTTTALVGGDLPVATSGVKGAVRPGTGLTVDGSGILNVSAATNAVLGGVIAGSDFGINTGTISLATQGGLTAGTYTKATYNSKGIATGGSALTAADIPNLSATQITSGSLDIGRIGANTVTGAKVANYAVTKIGDTQPTADYIGQFFFNPLSRDLALWDGNVFQPIGISIGEIVFAGTFDASLGSGTGLISSVTVEGTAIGLAIGQALPAPAAGNSRYYLVVAEAGTITTGNAPHVALSPPDILLSNGITWTEIDVSQTVTAQTANNISFTPAGSIVAVNVQTAIQELDGDKLAVAGGTVTGNLEIGTAGSLSFEGATANTFETTLAVTDPTADRTITLPDTTGTVITTGDTGTVTSTMLVNGTILDADINASAAISGSKIVAASTSVVGAVQLTDSFSSTSLTTAATPNSVKSAYDLAAAALPLAGGTLTGPAGITLGTALLPGLFFSGDPNTGLFSTGADNLSVTTGGVAAINVSSSGGSQNVIFVGPVGITPGTVLLPGLSFSGDLDTGLFSTGANNLNVATGGVLAISVNNDQNVTFANNVILDNQADARFREATANGTNYVGFQAPASIAADVLWTLPAVDGTAGQVISTNGSGTLSWASAATGDVTLTGTQTLTNKTLTSPILTTPQLGTPSSGTLTSCTGLPISGLTASTSTALGVGSIELGNASDTTLSRSAAGVLAVEGVVIPSISSTNTLTNKTLTDPAIIGTILEDIFTITDGAAFEVDPGNGSIQLITLGASRTPKCTNFVAGESVTLMVNDGTAYTITWTDATWGTGGVIWKGGTAPTLATTGYSVIQFWKVSTQVYGASVGDVA